MAKQKVSHLEIEKNRLRALKRIKNDYEKRNKESRTTKLKNINNK